MRPPENRRGVLDQAGTRRGLVTQRGQRGAELRAEHRRADAFLRVALGQDEIGGVAVQPDPEPRGVQRRELLREQAA